MGLSLEFYLGNAELIANAVADIEPDRLNDAGVATHAADLSLHITPSDLNLLSESIGQVTGQIPQTLGASLDPIVDEEDRGALRVSQNWVRYVAPLQTEQIDKVSELWVSAMRTKHEDLAIVVTDDMKDAIYSLLLLCQAAIQGDGEVVHVWYL